MPNKPHIAFLDYPNLPNQSPIPESLNHYLTSYKIL